MNRARQVREVFSELRTSLGSDVSAAEALECAAALVDLFTEGEDTPGFSLRTGGVPFEMRAVDVALADGGWRVLCQEWNHMGLDSGDGYGGGGMSSDLSIN